MTITVDVRATGDLKAIQSEIDRTVRRIRRHVQEATQLPIPHRPVPYRHSVLFREPVYLDGMPYAEDDPEDDEPATITV